MMAGRGSLVRGAFAGFVGGLLAAGAMSLAHRLVADMVPKPEASETQPADDATVKVASQALRLIGRPLAEDEKPLAGSIVHYGFGAVIGSVYGAVAEVMPRVTVALGLPFGIAVWLGAHVIAVPALGLADPPMRRPVGKDPEEFGLHLVYGLTTELVRRLLHR